MPEGEDKTKEDKTKDDAAAATATLQERVQKSDRALAIERAARAEAERRGKASAADAERYRAQVETSAVSQNDATITSLQSDRDRLKKEYSAALEAGDFEKSADLQFQMGEVATKLTHATAYKNQLEAKAKEKPAEGFDRETFINKQTPATAAWLRQHEDYFTDDKLRSRVAGAHNLAIGQGIVQDTPEYFEFVEKTAGIKQDEATGDDPAPVKRETTTPRAGQQRFAAPPTRDGGSMGGPKLKPGDRYISPEMRRAAEICDVKPEQYYDDYVKLVQEGRISDTYNVMNRR